MQLPLSLTLLLVALILGQLLLALAMLLVALMLLVLALLMMMVSVKAWETDRQLALMNFSIEAGILLRGNGVPHAMLDIYVLFARGLPDAFVSQPTQLPHSYTHTRS